MHETQSSKQQNFFCVCVFFLVNGVISEFALVEDSANFFFSSKRNQSNSFGHLHYLEHLVDTVQVAGKFGEALISFEVPERRRKWETLPFSSVQRGQVPRACHEAWKKFIVLTGMG